MNPVACNNLLLKQDPLPPGCAAPSDAERAVLNELAGAGGSVADRSLALFQRLRKANSKSFTNLLAGIQYLAAHNDPTGARLLAAFLAVGTAGERLLPKIAGFRSARRLHGQILADARQTALFQKDWLRRLDDLTVRARGIVREQEPDAAATLAQEPDNWPLLKRALKILLDKVTNGQDLSSRQRVSLGDMVELEVDAWQERISCLAGKVDPFRVVWVARLLPILGNADVEVRDLRQFVSWIREGRDQQAFYVKNSRAKEVLDEKELARLRKLLTSHTELQTLCRLYDEQAKQPLTIGQLAAVTATTLAVTSRLHDAGWRDQAPDLLTCLQLVRHNVQAAELVLPLDQDGAAMLDLVCNETSQSDGAAGWPTADCRVVADQLVVTIPVDGAAPQQWPDDFPLPHQQHPSTRDEADPAPVEHVPEEEEKEAEMDPAQSAAAIKQLVLNNLHSVSILKGFLRNAKITSIPGLVGSVATRTRNPEIVATIASDRSLYTGFANRDVPLACLHNPSNVSIKVLRKFVHVKYVSKVELRRMAKDTAALRKEVVREINFYLEALG